MFILYKIAEREGMEKFHRLMDGYWLIVNDSIPKEEDRIQVNGYEIFSHSDDSCEYFIVKE